jgi:hypothetical protein
MFDFSGSGGQTSGTGADYATLMLGIDASRAVAGANQFTQATTRVQGQAQQLNRALGPVASGMASVGMAFKGVAVVMAALGIVGMVREVNSLAARFDELDVALTAVGRNVGYSRPQLAGLEKDLQKTGISALQSRQSLLKMMQANLDLTQATKLARAAQDVAVVGQLNSSDALARMTHGIVSGQTEVLRTIGINVQFEAGYKTLAKSLNKTQNELTAKEKVQSRMNSVLKQAATLEGLYEASMTSAAKQMRSTQRYTEDLGVALGAVFQPAYTTLVFAYADALKQMAQKVKENEDPLTRTGILLDATVKHYLVLVAVMREIAGVVGPTLGALGGWLQLGKALVLFDAKGLEKGWDRHTTALGRLGNQLGNVKDQVLGVNKAMDAVTTNARNQIVGAALTSKSLERFGIARPNTGIIPVGSVDFFAPTGPGIRSPFKVFSDPSTRQPTVDNRVTASQTKAILEGEAAAATAALEKKAEAMKEAAKEAKGLRRANDELMDSYRDVTSLEQFLTKLKATQAEWKKAGLSAAEIETRTAKALHVEGLIMYREQLAELAGWADTAKDALNATAQATTGVRVDRLVEKMKTLWAVQKDIAELTREADRAERARAIQTDLVPVLGQKGADAFQAKIDDFEEKQRVTGTLVAGGINAARETAMADEIVKQQRRVLDAQAEVNKESGQWVETLAQGLGVLTQLASLARQLSPEARQGLQGATGALQGVVALQGLKNGAGEAVSVGKALSGGAGAAAGVAALSGVGAVIIGVAAVADAFDVFGTRAKERARQMEAAAAQFNRALDEFARAGEVLSSVQASIKALTRDAGTLVTGLAAATGVNLQAGRRPEEYLTRQNVDAIRTRGQGLLRDGNATNDIEGVKLIKFAQGLAQVVDALEARIKALVPVVMEALNVDYLQATGQGALVAIAEAGRQLQDRLANLKVFLDAGELTTDAYAEAVRKSGVIHTKAIDEINKAAALAEAQAQRAAVAFDTNNAGRILDAGNNPRAAEDARRTNQYENELAEAREANRDVTQLLIAQELEWIQVQQQRAQADANARTDRNLSGFQRDAAIVGGPVAGQLAGMATATALAVRAIQQDTTLTNDERVTETANEIRRSGAEMALFIAGLRQQFQDGLAGLNAELARNPIESAILSSGLQMQQALAGYRDLLSAGVITDAEFAAIETAWGEKRERLVAIARENVLRSQEGFAVDAANAAASLTGSASDRFAAGALEQTTNVEQRIRAAKVLVDEGTITSEAFEAFAKTLRDSVAPALLETAFAAEEAARIMQANLTTLNQQWAVFGADANEQLADTKSLLGFGGMDEGAIRALFTRATPGVELTAAQMAMNDKIAQYFQASSRAQSFNESQAAITDREAEAVRQADRTSGAGGVTMNYSRTGVQTISEGTAMRLVDISLSQLLVLRSIDQKSGGASSGGVTVNVTVSGASLNGMTARDAGNTIARQVAPAVDEILGRQAGRLTRETGNVAITS